MLCRRLVPNPSVALQLLQEAYRAAIEFGWSNKRHSQNHSTSNRFSESFEIDASKTQSIA
jgi:hypothetical protein